MLSLLLFESTGKAGQAIARKSRGREAETLRLPTRVRSAGDTGAVPCTP